MLIFCIAFLEYDANQKRFTRVFDRYEFCIIKVIKEKNSSVPSFIVIYKNQKLLDIKMEKNVIISRNFRTNDGEYIVQLIINNGIIPQNQEGIKSIWIRNVKVMVPGKSGKKNITGKDIQLSLKNYADNLWDEVQILLKRGGCNTTQEAYEKIFKMKNTFRIEGEGLKHSRNNKITDLFAAIRLYCMSDGNNQEATSSNTKKRFEYGAQFEASLSLVGRIDDRTEKDFSVCKTLFFDDAKLKWINPKWFVPSLSSLTIQTDNVFNIPRCWKDFTDNIGQATNLKELQLVDCMLSKIPNELFLCLSKTLQTLTLTKNSLTELSPEITALENLMHLDISNNRQLTSEKIPWEQISDKLRTLKLNDTGVIWLPENLGRFKDLHILEIVTPDLQPIGFELLLPRLKQLYIKNNDYKNISKMSLSPRRLKMINANTEDFDDKYIPKIVQFLDLSFNTFNNLYFPDHLTNLRELRLTHCSIKSISLSSLPEFLTVLDLSHNEITDVENLEACPRLREVYLHHNHLTHTVHGFDYNRLSNLDLSHNHISKLSPNFINRNTEWLDLNLGYNKFHADNGNLDERLWKYLPKTKRLNLSGNRLFEVPCVMAGKIKSLIAENCQIHFICPKIYTEWSWNDQYRKFHMHLDLADNPIKNLSFIPKVILSPPTPLEKLETVNLKQGRKYLHLSTYDLRSKVVFPRDKNKKPLYEFEIAEPVDHEKHLQCKCCAVCGTQNETSMIQQMMVMDICLTRKKDVLPLDNISLYKPVPSLQPGKWHTKIRTRLCEHCMDVLITLADKAYDEFLVAEDSKKKLSENTSNAPSLIQDVEMEVVAENVIASASEDAQTQTAKNVVLTQNRSTTIDNNLYSNFNSNPLNSEFQHLAPDYVTPSITNTICIENNGQDQFYQIYNQDNRNVNDDNSGDWPMMDLTDNYFTQSDYFYNNHYDYNFVNTSHILTSPAVLQPFNLQNEDTQPFVPHTNISQQLSLTEQLDCHQNPISNDQYNYCFQAQAAGNSSEYLSSIPPKSMEIHYGSQQNESNHYNNTPTTPRNNVIFSNDPQNQPILPPIETLIQL